MAGTDDTLDDLFRAVLERYPVARAQEQFGRGSSFWPVIAKLKSALEAVPAVAASKRLKVKVSFGQGGWAEVPNFALMDTRETDRPSAGLYMVYLVRGDGRGIVLSLNQGSADVILEHKGRVYDVLRARSVKVREAIKLAALIDAGFTIDPVDLAAAGQYPRAYAAGNVVSKTYPVGAIPSSDVLHADLGTLYAAYQALIPSARLRLGDVGRPAVASSRWRA